MRFYRTAMHSISTRAFFGRAAICTQLRAGETAVEIAAVDLVHRAEIPQILHKYCRLDDIVQRQTGLLQHSLQILERLVRLGLHALGQCAGGGVQAELAAAIDGVTGVNSLGIGAQGGGAFVVAIRFIILNTPLYYFSGSSVSGGHTKPRRARQSCKNSVACFV